MVAMVEKLSRYKFEILVFAAVIVAVFVLYGPALRDGFVYDDTALVANNPQIASLGNWTKAFSSCIWEDRLGGTCYERTKYYRPLHTLSIMFTYAISPQPLAFHLANIVYYIILNFLVFLFLYKLFRNRLAAVLGTALFLFHPVHSEPVIWISALPELLLGIFAVLAFLAHISEWRGKNWWSAGFFFLALLSKETAVVIPLILIAYDYFWRGENLGRGKLNEYAPHLILAAYYFILRVWAIGLAEKQPYIFPGPSLADKLAASVTALGIYVQKVFYPWPLSSLIDISQARFGFNPAFVFGAVVLIVLVGVAVLTVVKRYRVAGLGVATYILFLAVPLAALVFTANLRSEFIVADRYLFMPLLGVVIIFGYYLALLIRKSRWPVRGLVFLVLAVVTFASAREIYAQDTVWRSYQSLTGYLHEVNAARGVPAVQTDFSRAVDYEQSGDLNQAIRLDQAIIARGGDFPLTASLAANHLGLIYYHYYRNTDKARYFFNEALKFYPESTVVKRNLDVLDGKAAPTGGKWL